jgi:hypothetical protein
MPFCEVSKESKENGGEVRRQNPIDNEWDTIWAGRSVFGTEYDINDILLSRHSYEARAMPALTQIPFSKTPFPSGSPNLTPSHSPALFCYSTHLDRIIRHITIPRWVILVLTWKALP